MEDMIDHRSYAHQAVVKFKLKKIQACYFIYLYIHLHSSPFTGILRTHNVNSLDGLIAQLVEHYTGVSEIMGSSPFRYPYADIHGK